MMLVTRHGLSTRGTKSARRYINLYHILNHLNLLGGGYEGQALRIVDQLLAEPQVS
uniref:fructosamine kinase family protein n=1 Tax=Candidatus Vondammii sp. HM_W22 TaxID=2687299 RepID=UPI002E7ADAD5|nr:fructosamine kinase family protein [Candidatus Vondammii sp. HM_W22]